jgi:hypothetical protein
MATTYHKFRYVLQEADELKLRMTQQLSDTPKGTSLGDPTAQAAFSHEAALREALEDPIYLDMAAVRDALKDIEELGDPIMIAAVKAVYLDANGLLKKGEVSGRVAWVVANYHTCETAVYTRLMEFQEMMAIRRKLRL